MVRLLWQRGELESATRLIGEIADWLTRFEYDGDR
jgi:hypothetical protein